MSGEFDSRKVSHSTKSERSPRIFVKFLIFNKLSFRELCDSDLSDLHPFHNMAIIN